MSGWFWGGAAAGVAARRLLDKRKRAQAEEELERATYAISAEAVGPPLAVETWFNAPGLLMFGLPRRFRHCEGKARSWPARPPLIAVEDGPPPTGMWIAVLGEHLSVELTAGHSVWVTVVNPEAYRQAVRSWGGTVTTGPVPILVAGERGVWSVIDSIEHGQHMRRWSVLTMHMGAPYEVMMGLGQEPERACADAFWTAIGSWRWADMVDQPTPPQIDAPQSSATAAAGSAMQQVGGQVGTLSPDGQWYWDGANWKSAISPDGRWRWSGQNWVENRPQAPLSSATGLVTPSGDLDEAAAAAAVDALRVSPITPPLQPESWFSFPNEFSFGLPRNFAVPSPQVVRVWEGGNGPALVCVEDPQAPDYPVFFLMVQRNNAIAHLEGNSMWAVATMKDKFREGVSHRGIAVVQGPDPILVGGEPAVRYVQGGVDAGVPTRNWVAMVSHRGRGYDVTMFVKASAEARYSDAFLTVLGSWTWTQ